MKSLVLLTLGLMAAPVFTALPADSPSAVSEPDSDDKDKNNSSHPRIRFTDLGAELRFNYMDLEGGGLSDRGMQYRLHSKLRGDLRKDGSTYVEVRAETGKFFDNSWDNTAYALGSAQSAFHVKSMMLHQKISERFALEFGGLDFEQGGGSDAVYASDDGYMTGYRIRYDGTTGLLPVKVALTGAYLGGLDQPDFFSRARFNRLNYIQLLGETELSEIFHASGEVDSIHNVVYGRAALRLSRLWIFDEPAVEAVVRTTDGPSIAWSASISRRFKRDSRWRAELILAGLPSNFYTVHGQRFLLNREEIDTGKRLGAGLAFRLARELEFKMYAGRLIDHSDGKRWIAQMGISYEFAGFVNRFLR